MQLTRAQLFGFRDAHRASIYRNRLVNAKIRHAKWAAKQYTRYLLADGTVRGVDYRGRYNWCSLDAVALGGYKLGIQHTLSSAYQVHPALLEYASRLVASEMGVDADLTPPQFIA